MDLSLQEVCSTLIDPIVLPVPVSGGIVERGSPRPYRLGSTSSTDDQGRTYLSTHFRKTPSRKLERSRKEKSLGADEALKGQFQRTGWMTGISPAVTERPWRCLRWCQSSRQGPLGQSRRRSWICDGHQGERPCLARPVDRDLPSSPSDWGWLGTAAEALGTTGGLGHPSHQRLLDLPATLLLDQEVGPACPAHVVADKPDPYQSLVLVRTKANARDNE